MSRFNRALRTIRSCNRALAQATSETHLLEKVCNLIIAEGGYRMAWVGYAEYDAQKTVRPMARAGADEGYLAEANITWADEPHGHGPVGTAIRTGRPGVCRSVRTDPAFGPWRALALAHGFESLAVVPLLADGVAFGALGIYAAEPDVFDREEVELLGDLANDLAFGILAQRTRAERERMEEALRNEQELFASLIRTIPDYIYFKDGTGRFVRINDRMAQDLGLSHPAMAAGRTDGDFFAAEYARQAQADDRRVMDTGEPMVAAVEKVTWPDGRITWASTTKVPLRDREGRITGLVGITRDITERKKLEAQYLQAQKMEAFGQLAGGVAHDFNNIIAAVLMQLNLLQLESGLPEPIVNGLAELVRHAERAAALTRQLLVFSRSQEMEARQLDLNTVVEDLCKMLRRLLGENIAFEFKKAARPLWVVADVGMIEQVVMNLCINARDAMAQGGRLLLETRLEEPQTGDSAGRHVCLSVTDTGCGMDEAVKARIFEPFFTTKPVGKGTGLGLATVYGIVQLHGGRLEVDSTPGHGSTFRVYFALREPAAPLDLGSKAPENVSGGTESILLVEDDEAVRGMITASLRRVGYQVTAVPNGVEALRQWEERGRRFDLLLTDYLMPEGLTGLQLADQLTRAHPSLQVVVMSGYHPGVSSSSSPWPAHIARLAKPFVGSKLLEMVRRVLDHK